MKELTLMERLSSIPIDAILKYEFEPTHHGSFPVGALAKEAHDEIYKLKNEIKASKQLTKGRK